MKEQGCGTNMSLFGRIQCDFIYTCSIVLYRPDLPAGRQAGRWDFILLGEISSRNISSLKGLHSNY